MYKIILYLLSTLSSVSVRRIAHWFTRKTYSFSFSCIVHLNQHHDILKNDIDQTIREAETHRLSLEEQIERLKQQQITLNDFYERETKNLNHIHQVVKNICDNNFLLVSDYERYMKQWQLIKQDQTKNSSLQSFIVQIDRVLQEHPPQQQRTSFDGIDRDVQRTNSLLVFRHENLNVDDDRNFTIGQTGNIERM